MLDDFYTLVTHDIRVSVRSFYLAEQSHPDAGEYLWAYRVRLDNLGSRTVQLLHRTWEIMDGRGCRDTVQGEGVIGQQPVLEPGDSFEYTSGTPLSTPSGFMSGRYQMVDVTTRETFDVIIPTFSLDRAEPPGTLH